MTVPVGAPPDAGVTVAVNVTGALTRDGFDDDVSVVLVAIWTPVAVSVSVPILMQVPPASGHSKASKCAVLAPSVEAVKGSPIEQAASLFALQPLVSSCQGGGKAPSALERLASEYPASRVTSIVSVFVVPSATSPKESVVGANEAAAARAGSVNQMPMATANAIESFAALRIPSPRTLLDHA